MIFLDSTVYKCNLLTITEDVIVNADESKKTNIANAKIQPAITLMVQKSLSGNYFKEIITGKIIPAYREIYYKEEVFPFKEKVRYSFPKKPYFIKYVQRNDSINNEYTNDLKEPSLQEVKEYIKLHSDNKKFANILDTIFNQAEEYYNESLAKNNLSDEKQIKNIVKSLKKKRF